eukprot:Nk52_evm46s208 gene=Nk52_evmTU46s208
MGVSSVDDENEPRYCHCKSVCNWSRFMIECSGCEDWFHADCIGKTQAECELIELYYCKNCEPIHGPSTLKRERSSINYGEMERVGRITGNEVDHTKILAKTKFPQLEYVKLDGKTCTIEYFNNHGFRRPIFLPKKTGLGMKVPAKMTVRDVMKHVGPNFELPVMNTDTQSLDTRVVWTMEKWVNYYYSTKRERVLNIISMEFTDTKMNKVIESPDIVRKVDWIDNVWKDQEKLPRVKKYCLMSAAGCYTDFHIDFGGSSVWYHVVEGEKIFYFIPPTPENLKKFGEWNTHPRQHERFFGKEVDVCYECRLVPGNTLLIPTGWIHAVVTPKDSLVFGGNFLHSYNLELQLKVYDMENIMKVEQKFRFPYFREINWYAGQSIVEEFSNKTLSLPSWLSRQISFLASRLKKWKKDAPKGVDPEEVLAGLDEFVANATQSSGLKVTVKTTGALMAKENSNSPKLKFTLKKSDLDAKEKENLRLTLKFPSARSDVGSDPAYKTDSEDDSFDEPKPDKSDKAFRVSGIKRTGKASKSPGPKKERKKPKSDDAKAGEPPKAKDVSKPASKVGVPSTARGRLAKKLKMKQGGGLFRR